MTDRDRIERKIRRLLAIADDLSASQEERELAAAKARELMVRYHVDHVDQEHSAEDYVLHTVAFCRRRTALTDACSSLARDFFFVRTLYGWEPRDGRRLRSVLAFGLKADTRVAHFVWHYLHRTFSACWVAYRDRSPEHAQQQAGYVAGLYAGLDLRLRSERRTSAEANALVRVSDRLDEQFRAREDVGRVRALPALQVRSAAANEAILAGFDRGRQISVPTAMPAAAEFSQEKVT